MGRFGKADDAGLPAVDLCSPAASLWPAWVCRSTEAWALAS